MTDCSIDGRELRLEVDRCFAAIHIEGYRYMLMGDHPLAVDLAVANGCAHPGLGFFPICPLSADPVEAVGEGHVIARREAQVANLVANRPPERGEPFRPVLSVCIGS